MRSVHESLREYAQGVAGGLMFSLPLLYTMEVWWAGFLLSPLRLLGYVVVTFGLLLGYNRYAGLRPDASFAEVAIDSVEEMGLGLILAALVLWLLGRIDRGMPSGEILGQIVIEAMTVAIGVSVGTAQLGDQGQGGNGQGPEEGQGEGQGAGSEEQGKDQSRGSGQEPGEADGARGQSGNGMQGQDEERPSYWGQLVLAFCGAVLFAANVAPTEEIVVVGIEAPAWKLLGLVLGSLVVGGGILHHAHFLGSERVIQVENALDIVMGTTVMYAVALISSAVILWFFGRFDGMSVGVCLAETVVLGAAATLGASAGRLLIQ